MICQKDPYKYTSVGALIDAIKKCDIIPITRDISKDLNTLIKKMLKKVLIESYYYYY
jgi:hypothetical protein